MKKHTAKGFTLVEIMIVVAIIGIIIAIAVPAFLRARENARGQACQENLSKIDGAKEQYALEFRMANEATLDNDWDDLIKPGGTTTAGAGYLKSAPQCPSNGEYTLGNIGEDPICSYGEENPDSEFVKHIIPGGTATVVAP